ncbi:hypothetical protein TWF481_002089 [Arthrobotrys musiformis]|uniref:alpha-L-rhamnosidase n=1 Tax=Arthrobotrys musiformis TaxID=47236 RepID=A0AAV9VSC6_9PEZI
MSSSPFEITNLRLSQTSNPIGVDDPSPLISWAYSVPSNSESWRQQTYIFKLRTWSVGDSPGTATSYVVVGPRTSRTENVPWPQAFPQVESRVVYELLVTAVLAPDANSDNWKFGTPEGSQLSPLSVQAVVEKLVAGSKVVTVSSTFKFEGGLVGGISAWRNTAPTLAMITTPWDLENWENPKPVTVLRNAYHLKSKPRGFEARAYATAFGVYAIFINGKRVGDSIMEPGWTEYSRRVSYQTYDITDLLRLGENIFTVYVADGWYRGRLAPNVAGLRAKRAAFGKETGFMAVFDTYTHGKRDTFWTGPTNETGWKCTKTTPILDSGIYDGEHYDSRINVDAIDVQDQGEYGWKDVKVVTGAFADPKQTLQASISPPIRWTQTLSVKALLKSPENKTIVDFGQNITGRISLKGSAPAGTKITLLHVEVLKPDGAPNTSILREALCTDSYIFSGHQSGVEEWEPEFTFHGFRYAQVDPWIDGLELQAKVYGNDLSRGLKFESTNPELNRLVQNIEWSARGNFFAVPTDCPQRDERLGWAGDINVFSPTAAYVFDCQTFLKSWLQGMKDGQEIGGVHRPPIISPNVFDFPFSHSPIAVWEDAIVTLPWTLYQAYGDTRILSELYPSMVDYITKGIRRITEGEHAGMWKKCFQFGDWLDPAAPPDSPQQGTDPIFVADSWLCRITNTMAKISAVLQKDDARDWALKASTQVSKWQNRYLVPPKPNSLEPPVVLLQDTQTAYSLALNFHLLPEEYKQPAVARLHHLIRERDYHPTTGIVGSPEILHAVTFPRTVQSSTLAPWRAGNETTTLDVKLKSVALAYKLLLGRRDIPSWLYPITRGATSIWERWDSVKIDGTTNADWMTSLNHYALGSVGRWIFENVGGITINHDYNIRPANHAQDLSPAQHHPLAQDEEEWKVIFDPIPNLEHGITGSQMVFESPKGRVECKWEYDAKEKTLSIEAALPGNSKGEIRILGKTEKNVGAGRWIVKKKLEEAEWRSLEAGEGEQGAQGSGQPRSKL